jgi:hypothetical protein
LRAISARLAVGGERGLQLDRVETGDRAIAHDRQRHRPEPAREQRVVRAIVFVDVVRLERLAFS